MNSVIRALDLVRLAPFKVQIIDGAPFPGLQLQIGRSATPDEDDEKNHQGCNNLDLAFL